MRLTITHEEYIKLTEFLRKNDGYNEQEILIKARDAYLKSITIKKLNATQKAHKTKINTSIKKVENAINLLRMEGKKINANTISKTADITYKTASKYLKQLGRS